VAQKLKFIGYVEILVCFDRPERVSHLTVKQVRQAIAEIHTAAAPGK
jgi:hypothetical protein